MDYLNTTHQNIGWFHQIDQNGDLQMRPPFQRKPVWVTRQKSYLIDTILHGYPIPEIYMQETVDHGGKSKHVLVDGQQRIRSVLEFIRGEFAMDPKDSPEYADMSFDDLLPEQKKSIFQYKFIVRTLPELADVELREIFKRINTNVVSLNAQELRQATYWGPFITTINKLSNDLRWNTIGLFTANDIRRMLDAEFISELAVALLHGLQNKKTTLEKYYRLYEEEFEDRELLVEMFDIVLGEINQLLPDIRKTRWNKKSDFYTLFFVMGNHVNELPLSSNKRERATKILKHLAEQVDKAGKAESSREKMSFSPSVRRYSKYVARAASDLGSRRERAAVLEEQLSSIFK